MTQVHTMPRRSALHNDRLALIDRARDQQKRPKPPQPSSSYGLSMVSGAKVLRNRVTYAPLEYTLPSMGKQGNNHGTHDGIHIGSNGDAAENAVYTVPHAAHNAPQQKRRTVPKNLYHKTGNAGEDELSPQPETRRTSSSDSGAWPWNAIMMALKIICFIIILVIMISMYRCYGGGESVTPFTNTCPEGSLCVSIVSHEQPERADEWMEDLREALSDRKIGSAIRDWDVGRNKNPDLVYIDWIDVPFTQTLECERGMFPSWRQRQRSSSADVAVEGESDSDFTEFVPEFLNDFFELDEKLEASSVIVCMPRLVTGRDVRMIVHPDIDERLPPELQFATKQLRLKQPLASKRKTARQRVVAVPEEVVDIINGEKVSESTQEFVPPEGALVDLIADAVIHVRGVWMTDDLLDGRNPDTAVLKDWDESLDEPLDERAWNLIDTALHTYKDATDSPIDPDNRLKMQRRLHTVVHLGSFLWRLHTELDGEDKMRMHHKISTNFGWQSSSDRLFLQTTMAQCMLAREFRTMPTRPLLERLTERFFVDYHADMKKIEPAWRVGALFDDAPSHEECVELTYEMIRARLHSDSPEFCTWRAELRNLMADPILEFCIEPLTGSPDVGWGSKGMQRWFAPDDEHWSQQATILLAHIARSLPVTQYHKTYLKLIEKGPDELALVVPLAAMLSFDASSEQSIEHVPSLTYRDILTPLIAATLQRYDYQSGPSSGNEHTAIVRAIYFSLYRYSELLTKDAPSYDESAAYFSKHVAELPSGDPEDSSQRYLRVASLFDQWINEEGSWGEEDFWDEVEQSQFEVEDPPTDADARARWLIQLHAAKLIAALQMDGTWDWEDTETVDKQLEALSWNIPMLLPFVDNQWLSGHCMSDMFAVTWPPHDYSAHLEVRTCHADRRASE